MKELIDKKNKKPNKFLPKANKTKNKHNEIFLEIGIQSETQGNFFERKLTEDQGRGMHMFESYRNQCRYRTDTSALQRRHKEGTGALKRSVSEQGMH